MSVWFLYNTTLKNNFDIYPYRCMKGCSKLQRGVNSAAIQDIVSAHNRLRQKVANGQERNQPSASNMKEMVINNLSSL